MRKLIAILLAVFLTAFLAEPAWAFCGFYVGKADAKLYNKASQVIIARQGERTVLTMANDYQGEAKDFALVVPVPTLLTEDQVNVGDSKILQRLDEFSAPRLVEYFDPDPCAVYPLEDRALESMPAAPQSAQQRLRKNELGVTVEAQFTVGEYDIVILSAKESKGLETWLRQNGYKIPQGASRLLRPYIQQQMKFFVAKVNLQEYANTGFKSLRPLMIAYESPKFMLPIRLGTINGTGEQDLLVYLLSPKGQIELTNYRTVQVASDVDIPEFVQQDFSQFYKVMFQTGYEKEAKKVAFLEYAWDMGSCDPCSADPLNPEELKKAGVFWLNEGGYPSTFITRLHLRYSRDKFPEDLQFQETANRQFFQGRYVIRHPFKGETKCDAAQNYQRSVRERQEREAQTLAQLTGWNINQIRQKIDFVEAKPIPWWRHLWRSWLQVFWG
jgi:hypothetical protein